MNEERECRKFKSKIIDEKRDLRNSLELRYANVTPTISIPVDASKRGHQEINDKQLRQYQLRCTNR